MRNRAADLLTPFQEKPWQAACGSPCSMEGTMRVTSVIGPSGRQANPGGESWPKSCRDLGNLSAPVASTC
jgi:hypothetical protein